MIGAGVFAVWGPVARTGVDAPQMLLALLIAGAVAVANGLSSAQLAAQYPTSGGAYVPARERLGAWPGFLAGWSFTIGKTASCAAMAATFATYAIPAADGWQRPVAALALVVVLGVNLGGVTRTAQAARILVIPVLVILVGVVVLGLTATTPALSSASSASPGILPTLDPSAYLGVPGAGSADAPARYVAVPADPWSSPLAGIGWLTPPGSGETPGPLAVLTASGLLFFAFAGYARITTLGEEVVRPRRTIPRAVVIALAVVIVIYLAVAVAVLRAVPPWRLAVSPAPLAEVVAHAGPVAVIVVTVGAALASLGALLALVTGVSRTALAMARTGDLPRILARVDARRSVPWAAEVAVALVAVVLVLTLDVRSVIGFSSFGVLLYYLVANATALTQASGHRFVPRAVSVLGALGCVTLAVALPPLSVVVGAAVLLVGVLARLAAHAVSRRRRGARSRPR
ncbi:amino acid permease [Schumannella soli]|uniref:Amino acid permease n=2 Tax=Schumannella soli TaxID=2590779 RepID=A0A506XZK6_9MICO|nr:amino acid permease [Schumannella soli]